MTEAELLEELVAQGETVIFLLQAGILAVVWCAGALTLAGWLYARIDRNF